MESVDVVFFGINEAGMNIYEWLCKREGTKVRAIITEKDQADLVKELQPDFIVSAGFDYLIPKDILDIPEKGSINIHPSLLPYNKGKCPNVWSIVDDTPAGATIHYMNEEFDEGEIIAQKRIEKRFDDDGKSLHKRLEKAQYDLFVEKWENIVEGDIETSPQEEKGKYYSLEDFKELCKLNPQKKHTTLDLINILRALTFPPFNNAYLEKNGEKYYIEIEIKKASEIDNDQSDSRLNSYDE